MKRIFVPLLFASTFAFAQPKLVTEFPDGAKPLAADALKKTFTGTSHAFLGANGVEVTMKLGATDAVIALPKVSDTGTWSIEGSAICFKLARFPSGCNEVRLVGDALYWKRNSNGEVVKLYRK